jgi:hypothetical protein
MKTVHTGWRKVTPGACYICGFDDRWSVDGRGNVLCDCQACPDCGIVDAYWFHESGCPTLEVSR